MTDPNIVLSVIPPEKIDAAWSELKPLFARAVQRVRTGGRVEDILAKAKAGQVMLWMIRDHVQLLGALATGIRKEQDGDTVFVFRECGGWDMHRWLDRVLDEIGDKFARAQGATRVEIEGRPGWEKVMRHRGFELARVVLQKAL